ncbi:hypothetical protein ACVR05_04330 [Streptococcus caprae]|uniref:Uncharacterized protein n=1 Tax=Streptococcus caprae TaxID=1640501 RepID=A0ABV8CXL8_9STRE
MDKTYLKTIIVTCKFPGCNKGPVKVGGNYCANHAKLVNQSQTQLGRTVSGAAMTGLALYQKYKPNIDQAFGKLIDETETITAILEPKVAEIKPKLKNLAKQSLEKVQNLTRK